MRATLPVMKDGVPYYLFLPALATLYGYTGNAGRFIRVVDDNHPNEVLTTTSGGEVVSTVETISVSSYLRRLTYGATKYIEPVLSGLAMGLDIGTYRNTIATQAMLRDYEHRADTLLAMCRRKKGSFASIRLHPGKTKELVAETEGVLNCWKHMMDTGRIRPADCIAAGGHPQRVDSSSIPLSEFEGRYWVLKNRMLNENFVALPYKMTEEQRMAMLSAFV